MDGNGSKRSGTGPATRKGPWASLKEVIRYLPAGGVKPDVYCDVATIAPPEMVTPGGVLFMQKVRNTYGKSWKCKIE